MTPAPVLGFALFVAVVPALSQDAAHQRLSVETESRHRVEGSLGASWTAAGQAWTGDCEASLEYAWKKSLGLRVAMPWAMSYDGREEAEHWAFRWGDPGAEVSHLWRGDRLRVQAGMNYSYPIERMADRGFHRFAPSLSMALVRDPVILTWSLSLATSLPQEEGGYLLWPAFSAVSSLSYWELLNDRISYRVGVSPELSLGTLRLGMGEPAIPRFRVGLNLTVSWDERDWGVQAGWSGDAPSEAGALDLRGSLRREW